MPSDRPEIPEPMKREVRQRCGFGCVICGLPLYEYEHMEGWANTKRHIGSEITLLCDRHHHEKTGQLLPLDQVREANKDPYNKRAGVSPPYDLHYKGRSCELIVGGNTVRRDNIREGTELIAVAIDRCPMLAFTFDQGHLFLTLQIYDDCAQRVVWIERNELRYLPSPWDIQLEGKTLTVRERQRRILVEVLFSPPNRVEVRKGRFSLNGLELLVQPDGVCCSNDLNTMSGMVVQGLDVAIMIGERLDSRSCAVYLPGLNRGKPDKDAAEKWMRDIARL